MPRVASQGSQSSEFTRVVFALMQREIKTRFGENHLGFIWLFIEPLLFVVPVVLFWKATRGTIEHGLPLVEFLMTGYAPFIMWRNCVSRSLSAISSNTGLLYHKVISPERIVFARCLLEIASSFVSMGLLFIVFILIGLVRMPHDFPHFLLGWIFMGIVSWACAVLFAALSEISHFFQKIINTFTYLFLGIGGAFYMVEWLPKKVQSFVVWIPTVQGFELIRFGYFGDVVQTHWSVFAMLICVLVPAAFGMHVLRFAREHMELE